MQFVLQLIYGFIGIGSTILDYFIINAFYPDIHHDIYRFLSEYTEIAELVVFLMLISIGIFVEMGGIKTHKAKTTWTAAVTTFSVIGILESLVRVHSMLVLAAHIAPGKIDFMGLFLVLVIMYLLLKNMVLMAHAAGLHDKIHSIKITAVEMPVYAYGPRDPAYFH